MAIISHYAFIVIVIHVIIQVIVFIAIVIRIIHVIKLQIKYVNYY